MRAFAAAMALSGAALLTSACSQEVRLHSPDDYPARLSEWGVILKSPGGITLGERVATYDINTPLFSDYALKLRLIWMPEGAPAQFRPDDSFDLPVGTILAKTFFYYRHAGPEAEDLDDSPPRLAVSQTWDGDVGNLDPAAIEVIETRLLVHQAHGWDALPYLWEGDDAVLAITGALREYHLTSDASDARLTYVVPTRNECDSCRATDHTSGATRPIGIKARHLDRGYHGAARNQLADWVERGLLDRLPPTRGLANADWDAGTGDLNHRARSYLDANCGHCHSPAGAADTSGLWLDYADHPPRHLGVCKPPVAAGRGSGGRLYSIVPGEPDASILVYRMQTSDPATRMPEIGRDVAHAEGVALVSAWVDALAGRCL